MSKVLIAIVFSIVMSGCSSFAKVKPYVGGVADMPISEMDSGIFIGLYYRNRHRDYLDRKTGVYNYKPLSLAERSYLESVATNSTGKSLIEMVPQGVKVLNAPENGKPDLIVYLDGLSTEGVINLGHRPALNIPMMIITLGFFPAHYYLNADFEITYEYSNKGSVYKKTYPIKKSYEHVQARLTFQKEKSSEEIIQKFVKQTHEQFWHDYKINNNNELRLSNEI